MARSPLALAALATVAVPGMDPLDARALGTPGGDLDTALVVDAEHRRWIVRAPVDAASGAALEAEIAVVGLLEVQRAAGRLPFAVPAPVGFAPLPEGGRAVAHAQIPGGPLDVADLAPGPGLAAELGRAIAALHELPVALVETLGLPTYEADDYRRRRQSEVDEAARTGRVPATLLARWEARLEDVAWWRFRPTVVHGDLSPDRVLVDAGTVSGILDWSQTMVADPADDLAWLLVAAPADAVESVIEAYQLRRTELLDPHLTDRALLAGELAVVRWLLFGVHTGDDAVVDDATAMLAELDEQTRVQAVDADVRDHLGPDAGDRVGPPAAPHDPAAPHGPDAPHGADETVQEDAPGGSIDLGRTADTTAPATEVIDASELFHPGAGPGARGTGLGAPDAGLAAREAAPGAPEVGEGAPDDDEPVGRNGGSATAPDWPTSR